MLIADDNKQDLYMLKVLLEGHGYKVASATNGVEALKAARGNPPDIILSDILMSGMDGFALCREWKGDKQLQKIPFVFYSATYTDLRDKEFALSLGAARFLVKPAEPEALLALVQEILKEQTAGKLVASPQTIKEESVYLKRYNEALIRKLEDKMAKANRNLERGISERKQADQAIRESEARYRLLAENLSDVIWTMGTNLKYTYVSSSVTRVRGYTVEEALTQPLQENMTPASLEAAMRIMAEEDAKERTGQYDPNRIITMEVELSCKDGSTIWAENKVNYLRDSNGQITGYLGVTRDMTRRKRAEEALGDSERRYRLLAENISDVIWVTDMNLRPAYMSPSITRLLGYSVEEAMARGIEDSLTPASLELASKAFAKAMTAEENDLETIFKSQTLDLEFKRKDSSTIWVSTTVSFIYGQDGRPVEIMGVLHDVADRKRAEGQLKQSFEKLEEALDGTIQVITSAVETRDPYTAGHQRRVTQLACAIAKEMSLSSEQIKAVRTSGLVHDLGKISVPIEILSKAGKLSEIEFAIIKTHSQSGYDILKTVEFPWPIAKIVLQHHEKVNGSGYPLGIKGEEILLEARILTVADVVEAMSSNRPYRPALGITEALKEISKNRGLLYDPNAVDACLRLFADKGFTFEPERVSEA